MGNPYTSQSVSNYNANPPSDDGSQVESNRVYWSTIKTKIGDPLNSFASAVNNAISTAFAKIIGGAGITTAAVNYSVQSSDQGKLVRATAAGITVTTPDATSVSAPFVFAVLNNSSGDIVIDGNGSQTIDGAETATLAPGTGCQIWTDGSNWYTDGQNFQRTLTAPQGYLSLVPISSSGINPIPSSDQSAKTAVYYRPFTGNLLPISDGSTITVKEFSELTLTLVSNHLASTIYDVFAFNNSGTIRIGTGPAWNNSGAGTGSRGTGAGTTELDVLKGLLVNKVAATMRNGSSTYSVDAKAGVYLGSIFIDGSAGQVSCHVSYGQSRKWGIWNAYNARPICLKAGDSTASWSYNSATVQAANGSSANSITTFLGIAGQPIVCAASQNVKAGEGSNNSSCRNYIGVNSTTAGSGKVGRFDVHAANGTDWLGNIEARHVIAPAIGIQTVTALESATVSGTQTFYGGSENMQLTAEWLG